MGRPRMPENKLSKYGVWKRQSRDNPAKGMCTKCGKRPATVKHHVKTHDEMPSGPTTSWCRECNAAHHNALRKKT